MNYQLKQLKAVIPLISLILFFMGCGLPPLSFGVNYDPTKTLLLINGQSIKSDVERVLGKARGYGVARHSPNIEPRNIWFYEYIQMKGDQVRLKILLVFFDQDIYEGYLWFSANELLVKGTGF